MHINYAVYIFTEQMLKRALHILLLPDITHLLPITSRHCQNIGMHDLSVHHVISMFFLFCFLTI